jgi:hypothetical protein
MDRLQMLQQAIRELGATSDQELAAFIQKRFGVRVEARFVPIWRASLKGQEVLERVRSELKAEITGSKSSSPQ